MVGQFHDRQSFFDRLTRDVASEVDMNFALQRSPRRHAEVRERLSPAPKAGAWFGLAACLLGALLAVSLIPEHFAPAGALAASGWAMALALAAVPVAGAMRNLRTLLKAEYLLMLSPIFWLLLDIIQGAYDIRTVDRHDVAMVFWCVALFVSGIWVAFLHRPWSPPGVLLRATRTEFSGGMLLAVVLAAFILGMLKYALPLDFDLAEMFGWLGRGRWGAPWGRGQLGGWDAFSDHLAYFGYLLPALTVLIARKAGWLSPKTLVAAVLTGVMALFLAEGGGRRIIGVVFGAALLVYILSARKVRLRQFWVALIFAAALLWALGFMLDYRNVGYRAAFSDDNPRTVLSSERDYYHVDDNFLRLAQVVHLFPAHHPFVYGEYVLWVLVRPVPRVFWPGKPVDSGFDLPEMVGMRGVSLSSSVLGELFASGGLVAVFLGGWLFGRLAGVANQLISGLQTNSAILLYSFSVLALFAGVRSMIDLVLMSYPLLAWLVLKWAWVSTKARRRGNPRIQSSR